MAVSNAEGRQGTLTYRKPGARATITASLYPQHLLPEKEAIWDTIVYKTSYTDSFEVVAPDVLPEPVHFSDGTTANVTAGVTWGTNDPVARLVVAGTDPYASASLKVSAAPKDRLVLTARYLGVVGETVVEIKL